jgi:hypothetical protein
LKISPFGDGACNPAARATPDFDGLIQLRLPIRDGGGGLTSVADITVSAFYTAFASTIQWLARVSEVHRGLIPPSPNPTGPSGPRFLGDFFVAFQTLKDAGASVVTPADLCATATSSQPVVVSGLACPSWDTLLLPSLPDGRAPCPAPRQHSVTRFLGLTSVFSPANLTDGGKVRLDAYKERKIDVVTNQTGLLSPLERCISHQGGMIRFCPVAFLAFTPGVASCPFSFNLWRTWFCFWLGFPLPEAQSTAPGPVPNCRCGAVFDSFGHHRLCCKQGDKPGVSSVRYKAHNLVAAAIAQCAFRAGLTSSAEASRVPALPGSTNPNKKGDLVIKHHMPAVSSRAAGTPERLGFIGDVAIVHPQVGASSNAALLGSWVPSRMDDRAKKKSQLYRAYDDGGWTFLPLITSSYCNLSDTILRLLHFLAELESDRALEFESLGDNPMDVLHKFASRSRAKVACTVAVGTAMRLLGSSRDSPLVRAPWGACFGRIDHDADVPLFPLGSEDCPFGSSFPLARGAEEYVEGYCGEGSLEAVGVS